MPISLDEIKFDLDLTKQLEKVPRERRSEAKQAAAIELRNAIEGFLASARSPVKKGQYKSTLSKDYKALKKKKGKSTVADLDLQGDMLNSMIVRPSARGVTTEIRQSLQKKKAFNHNVGDTLPQRQFIPTDDSNWKQPILKRINEVIEGFE